MREKDIEELVIDLVVRDIKHLDAERARCVVRDVIDELRMLLEGIEL